MVAYASFDVKSAWIGQEFGENFARRVFGDEVVDSLPKYSKGKNKDKIKASIEWIKISRGGWVRTSRGYEGESSNGYVENRVGKVIAVRIIQRD